MKMKMKMKMKIENGEHYKSNAQNFLLQRSVGMGRIRG